MFTTKKESYNGFNQKFMEKLAGDLSAEIISSEGELILVKQLPKDQQLLIFVEDNKVFVDKIYGDVYNEDFIFENRVLNESISGTSKYFRWYFISKMVSYVIQSENQYIDSRRYENNVATSRRQKNPV